MERVYENWDAVATSRQQKADRYIRGIALILDLYVSKIRVEFDFRMPRFIKLLAQYLEYKWH